MIQNYINLTKKILTNLSGWRTKQKIIVIESDDWGSIRMPSKQVYQKCINAGYRVDLNPYEKYDALESDNDLNNLFDLLINFKDLNNNHPVFTTNCCIANPDFKRIKENEFNRYDYEIVTDTFKKYPNHSKSFELWMKGTSEKLLFPQFHAREHLNVFKFMNALIKKDNDVLFGFKHEMPGMIKFIKGRWVNKFVESTFSFNKESKNYILESYLDGLKIFENLFGFKSESIIPTNYTWSDDFNEAVFNFGVKYFQGNRKYRVCGISDSKNNFKTVYLGKKNNYNQTYLVRNIHFEPTINKNINEHLKCLSEIAIMFTLNKPAIISTHRLNYIGFIDEKNRDKNLFLLNSLLLNILKKWPDVEFMNTVQLARLINEETRNT